MRIALVQLNSGDNPAENLPVTTRLITQAATQGAQFVATPEVTNIVSLSRQRQDEMLRTEAEDETLRALCAQASALNIWILIGSLALKGGARFVNRSFLIGPEGQIAARYDKIHMFDAQLDAGEIYHESARYAPGMQACAVRTPFGILGMAICYDLRFAALSSVLARAGAQIITYPSAFTPGTGAAHWESLLRARAIENGAWVIAPAQTGTHAAAMGKSRKTYGHSMIVDPWGQVVLDAGKAPGVYLADIDMHEVTRARRRIPSLSHARDFKEPQV